MKKNLMINLDKLKTCIENCKYAGDNLRNNNLFVSAAIMVIFSLDEKKNDQRLILIRRKKNLRKHAGQVAFPGGRFESDDKNLVKTALRETEEEINISENNLDVLGSLPVFYTGTGYAVTPFVAAIKNSFNYKKLMIADPNEVDKILIVNTSDLLMPSKQIRIKAPIGSKMKMTWKVAYKNENIWGLTARVLVTISAGLNLRGYPPCDDI